MDIYDRLFSLRDREYALFQAKLTPGVSPDRMLGVRVPELRKLARALLKEADYADFLGQLPHRYYDEDMLHSVLLSELRDYEDCIGELERFLPYVDNWAVCDILSPRVFKGQRERLLGKIREWTASKHSYTCRFGIGMLMTHYLDGDFRAECLEIPASVRSEEYYVNMMIAWFFATALAKQWDAALPYLEKHRLSVWTHNKTIQKARESYRITAEHKALLKGLKRQV